MFDKNQMSKLQHQLFELKLEERRVRSDIKHLVANQTIDFFKAKQLHSLNTNIKSRIKTIEGKVTPNIIA